MPPRATNLDADLGRLATQEILDYFATAVFFLSAERRVVGLNVEAERIMKLGDALSVDHEGKLRAAGPDAVSLARKIGSACVGQLGASPSAAGVLQMRRDEGSAYGVVVCSLRASRDAASARSVQPVVAVLVSDPDCRVQSTVVLRTLYGLTDAEARLACAIASGRTPNEAASALGITVNTARWTLKQVFAKTGTRRQVELARLVLVGPASFVIGDGGVRR